MSIVNQRFSLMTEFKRGSGDIDLVNVVYGLLKSYGINGADYFVNHPDIVMIKEADSHAQRYIVNRFFNAVFSFIRIRQGVNTTEQRTMLITDGSNEDWLRLFETGIIPLLATTGIIL